MKAGDLKQAGVWLGTYEGKRVMVSFAGVSPFYDVTSFVEVDTYNKMSCIQGEKDDLKVLASFVDYVVRLDWNGNDDTPHTPSDISIITTPDYGSQEGVGPCFQCKRPDDAYYFTGKNRMIRCMHPECGARIGTRRDEVEFDLRTRWNSMYEDATKTPKVKEEVKEDKAATDRIEHELPGGKTSTTLIPAKVLEALKAIDDEFESDDEYEVDAVVQES